MLNCFSLFSKDYKINILTLIKNHPTILFNKLILPNKLIEGELNKNHHKAILGIKFIKPLLINDLRLPNRSLTKHGIIILPVGSDQHVLGNHTPLFVSVTFSWHHVTAVI